MPGAVQYVSSRKSRSVASAAALAALAALLSGCSSGSGEGLDTNGRPESEGGAAGPLIAEFKSIQDNILTPLCATCHSGAAAPQGLRLDEASSYALMVGVASAEVPSIPRVDPGNPDNSYLVQKLEGTAAVGALMPLGGPALPQADIDVVRQWIASGALPAQDTQPGTPPVVVSIEPASGANLTEAPTEITALFSLGIDPSLFGPDTFTLERSGGDGDFDNGNEVALTATAIAPSATNSRQASFALDPNDAELVADDYRITLVGTGVTALAGPDGTLLDGDGDGTAGGDFVSTFSLTTLAPTLQSLQETIFTPSCATAGCHTGPAGPGLPSGLDLSTADASFTSLVNVASEEVPTLLRVQPDNSADSYLILKVLGTAAVGARMPLGGQPLSDAQINALASWIDSGAPFDDVGGTPDTSAPVVTITPVSSPVTGTVVLSAAAVDDIGVIEVRYLLDGALLGISPVAPYSVAWDTSLTADGSYALTAEAEDAAGNVGQSAVLTVTVGEPPAADDTPPMVALDPLPAEVSGLVALSATASDDTAVTQVTFLVDGQALDSDSTEPYATTWDSDLATLGAHSITAQAWDAAGNSAVSAPSTTTVIDATPPAVALTSPVANQVAGMVTVAASATDNRSVDEVRLFVDGALLATLSAPPFEAVWDTATVLDGDHTLLAEAVDGSGNVATSTPRVVTVNNAPPADAEAPTVTLDAPAAPALVSGTVTLSATASDNIGVTELRFFANGNQVAALATPPFTADWDTTSVSDGDYSITAQAADLAGNTATTSAVVLTVDNSFPTVTAQAPADGETLDAFPAGISVTFSEGMAAPLFDASRVIVIASGGDGTFNDGNETALTPLGITINGNQLDIGLTAVAQIEDTFQLTISGSVTDEAGLPLDGNGDGNGGDDYTTTFTVDGLLPTLPSIQSRIFTPSCGFSGCHGGASPQLGLDLSSAASSYATLVGVDSAYQVGLLRVAEFDPDSS